MFSFIYYSQFFFCVFFLILVNSTDQINAFGIILNKFFFWLIGLGFVVSYGHYYYYLCVYLFIYLSFLSLFISAEFN
eukprot:gene36-17_t